MSIMANLKGRQAIIAQQKGNAEEAIKLYEEALAKGCNDARVMLNYSVLLIRQERYQEAKDLLVKAQKSPTLSAQQKPQLFVNYAVCAFKLGMQDKAIDLLERQSAHSPSGLIYETLGYLYVEMGDQDKALSYNQEALEYDDEDAIVLDNLGQTYYRLVGDKEKAKEYFDKAIAIRDTQLDTLYFLAQYDIDAGNNEAAKEKLETALGIQRFSPLNYATRERLEALMAKVQ